MRACVVDDTSLDPYNDLQREYYYPHSKDEEIEFTEVE